MQKKIAVEIGAEDAGIFDAHLLVLEDRTIIDEVLRVLKTDRVNIEYAFYSVVRRYMDSLRKIEDPYLRERVVDIQDVTQRVVQNLRGQNTSKEGGDLKKKHVVMAHALTPSDTASMDRQFVIGFATELGSQTSHAAIIARSMGIPAVVGLHALCSRIRSGTMVLVDGYGGIVISNPSEATLDHYRQLEKEKGVLQDRLIEQSNREAVTQDGHRITLSGNIEFAYEVPVIKSRGAEGVGLYRTEFFYLNRNRLPGEERQLANYERVIKGVAPHGAIIRTCDVGGDKVHPEAFLVDPEPNPFLGWRGIRVSLGEHEMFKTQLRAILQASASGKAGIMYPMISSLGELRDANALLEECKAELKEEGKPFSEEVEVGAMIEVPSAALIADALAKEVDFFSIGTNDLTQYTLAVDRVNERVSTLYQPGHPAVIQLIHLVVEAGRRHGIWVGVCGEMAGDVLFTPLLVGLGLDEFSVGVSQLPLVKHAIRNLPLDACKALAAEVLKSAPDADTVGSLCRKVAMEHYPELLV
jgi:phosphotransferase system enzyme I (PtsI)